MRAARFGSSNGIVGDGNLGLESLEGTLAITSAVVKFIYGPLAQNPHRVGKSLRFELAGKRSARRGNYRVMYELFEPDVQVEVIAVQHRGDIPLRPA